MLLSALITKAHFKLNGQSEAQALAKVRQWPQDPRRAAARTAYLDIVSRNNGSWRGQFLGDAQRALQSNGILAADPTDADEDTISNQDTYEYYFNATITMRYDSAVTPFTASESTRRGHHQRHGRMALQAQASCLHEPFQRSASHGRSVPDLPVGRKGSQGLLS